MATGTGSLDLYDPIKGERIKQLYGHLNVAAGIAFSPDGRRLISTFGGADAVKLWDLSTHQEMLTLPGAGSFIRGAHWTADEDAIVVGPPWQVWRAPSWAEVEAAERWDKASK